MTSFCTSGHLYDFLPTRTPDSSAIADSDNPETTDTAFAQEIAKEAKKITAPKLGVTFPVSEPDSLTNSWLLWEGLNVYPSVTPIIRTVSLATGPEVVRFASALGKFGGDRVKEWQRGELINGYLMEVDGEPLPIDMLCSVDHCITKTPGFKPVSGIAGPGYTPDRLRKPYIETIERFILRETAYVRVKASLRGLAQTDLTADQAKIYAFLVSGPIKAFVLAIHAFIDGYSADADAEVAHLLAEARREIELIDTGFYDDDLLPA